MEKEGTWIQKGSSHQRVTQTQKYRGLYAISKNTMGRSWARTTSMRCTTATESLSSVRKVRTEAKNITKSNETKRQVPPGTRSCGRVIAKKWVRIAHETLQPGTKHELCMPRWGLLHSTLRPLKLLTKTRSPTFVKIWYLIWSLSCF